VRSHLVRKSLGVAGDGRPKAIGQNQVSDGLFHRNRSDIQNPPPAIFLHPSEAQHGDLGILQKNDVLMVISNSGKTREIIELIDLTKDLFQEIPIIAITGHLNTPILEKVNCILFTGNPNEVCPLDLTPTTSTTVMTVIGDILVVLMVEKIGFTAEDYAKRHHSGYLGTKSRNSGKPLKT